MVKWRAYLFAGVCILHNLLCAVTGGEILIKEGDSKMRKKIGFSLLFVLLVLIIFIDSTRAVPIRFIPNLVSITFWERTGGSGPKAITFLANSGQLRTRRSDPLGSSNRDFVGAPTEFYDVFYSDADGSFDPDGEFVTIEAVWNRSLPVSGGLNIAEVQLNFSDASKEFANRVASFAALGDNAEPSRVGSAVDGNLLTHTAMGSTTGLAQRLRITVSFKEPFADFALSKVEVKFQKDPNMMDEFGVEGGFILGEDSDGIDPVNEEVVVTVGAASVIIPAGSFEENSGKYEFEGVISDAEVKIEIEWLFTNAFTFKVEVEGVDLTGTTNPMDIDLTIGDDTGRAGVWLIGELKFEAE